MHFRFWTKWNGSLELYQFLFSVVAAIKYASAETPIIRMFRDQAKADARENLINLSNISPLPIIW